MNVSVSCAYTQGKREQFSGFNRTLDAINNVFRKFSAFHDETGRLNVDGMNIISNDGSNKLNRSRKARVSYKVQRTITASLNAATSTRAAAEIQADGRVSTGDGDDVTDAYSRGAAAAVDLARAAGATEAVLKARSPSCGCHQVYDGTFTRSLVAGEGITAAALRAAG